MTCPLCKGEMKPGTTIHTVQLKNCVVVIKNVPYLKCEQCGEVVLCSVTAPAGAAGAARARIEPRQGKYHKQQEKPSDVRCRGLGALCCL